MDGTESLLEGVGVVALVGGFAYASVADLRTREVGDGLWQVLGLVGLGLGAVVVAPGGALSVALWVVAAGFALEHLFPWDDALGEQHARAVPVIEGTVYVLTLGGITALAIRWGIGPTAVPLPVVAAVATVLLARLLFEFGVLYGGADAKALIVAGLLVPVFAVPLVYAPTAASPLLGVMPFSLTLLMNAALLSLVVPLAIGVRNVVRGEFSFPRGFTSYTMPVGELPRRFVWVRDPVLGEDTLVDDAETSAEDAQQRAAIARDLEAKGVRRVWVTPQLPFLVLMAAGAFAALLAGNLLLDLFTYV